MSTGYGLGATTTAVGLLLFPFGVLAAVVVPGTAIPAWSGFATAFVIGAAISAIAVVLTAGLPARLSTVAPAVPDRT